MTRRDSSVLIIVPAFNEALTIGAVIEDLRFELPDADVLVVDDGSSDGTAAVAAAAGAAVAVLPFNLGIGGALRTGFKHAAREGYGRAVQFDADGQHLGREVHKLLVPLDLGADLVVGSRFSDLTDLQSYRTTRLRGAAMGLLRIAVVLAAGRRMSDTSSGFRAFGPRALTLFASEYPLEYMDSVEALLLAALAGLDVREVPVDMKERLGGVPSTRGWRLAYHYFRLLTVLVSSASLRRKVAR